jgi:molecular chaperone GrpE (heat shock protein)
VDISRGWTWLRQHWGEACFLVISVWVGVHAMTPTYNAGIAETKALPTEHVGWAPISLWREPMWHQMIPSRIFERNEGLASTAAMQASFVGTIGGVPGTVHEASPLPSDRKLTRMSAMELEVKSPAETADSIRDLAEHQGGYLMSSEFSSNQNAPSVTIRIRVPAEHFETTRDKIKALGLHTSSERIETADVTKEFVDSEARLRNLRAQEQQYLALLTRAASVKDILEVSDKLNSVHGEIEQKQAEFEALSKQVEMVEMRFWLYSEADAGVLGIHWRPWHEVKVAARDGLQSLAGYVGAVMNGLFQLPAVALWLATVIFLAALSWRILRWVWRTFFVLSQTSPAKAT